VGAAEGCLDPFFCDRNLGKRVPAALEERGWPIERHDDHFGQDTRDDVILRAIAERGWHFLTQDKKIRTRGPERRILLDYGIRTVSVASTANLSADATVAALAAAEEAIFHAVRTEEPPFIIAVYKDGSIRRLDFPQRGRR
jgi:PIN like domain